MLGDGKGNVEVGRKTLVIAQAVGVLAVSALGDSYADARRRAYEAADLIEFEDKHMRRDVALRAERSEEGRR